MALYNRLTTDNFYAVCDSLIKQSAELKAIVRDYGYPPFWTRPNLFSTLVLTILEQQVSLASAYAAYTKLGALLPNISPEGFIKLTDADLRSCYFSRQKIGYTRGLAGAIINEEIVLKNFEKLPDDTVRIKLKALKGIGDWTVDIYLIHALRRPDVFPLGDLALVNAVRMIKENKQLTKEEVLELSLPWKPFRSVATMILWHYYIKKRNIKLLH